VSLSRRQFVAVAERIRGTAMYHTAIKIVLCREFDRFFATYSTNYDSKKFVTACGFVWPLTGENNGPDSNGTSRTE